MTSGPDDNPTAKSTASLTPLLDEMSRAETLIELASTAARLVVELCGADAALVIDDHGPIAARPSALDPSIIAELWSAPVSGGGKPRTSEARGLRAVAIGLNTTRPARMTAAWDEVTDRAIDDMKSIASVLATRMELLDSTDRKDDLRQHDVKAVEDQRRTEEDFRELIETVPAIVYKAEMGEAGRWHFVSPQIERILGYTPEEWTSDPGLWFNSIHSDDIDHAMAFEDSRLIGLDVDPPAEYRLRAKDGRYVWIYERARLINDDNGVPVWHGVMQDITAQKAAETVVQQKIDQQRLIARLGEMAMKGEHPDRLIAIAVDSLVKMDRTLDAAVWEQDGFTSFYLCHASKKVGVPPMVPYETDRYPGNRLAAGEIVSILDWKRDPRVVRYRGLPDPKMRSSMMVPIGGSSEQFGMLTVTSDEPNRFSEQDGHFLRAAANILANAIDRNRADESLRHRLHHDPLTDLPNRQLFAEQLTEATTLAHESGESCGVLLLDIDHFKLINDGIGHHAGDEMLRAVASRLADSMRRGDTVARFGGDEFGIVLKSVQDEDDAHEIADRLLDALSEPIIYERVENFVTASIGIAIYTPGIDDGKVAESLIQEADAAMYQAKDMGRAQAQVFGQPMLDRALRRLEVERELRRAIEDDQLIIHYQPIVSLRTGQIFAFEALARWQHPTEGLIGPDDFIPIAEESDLITQIDNWVLRNGMRQMGQWQELLPSDRRLVLAVNASSRQIRTPTLPGLVADLLNEFDVSPERLALEITESVLVAGTSTVKNVLGELHDMGVMLALDDFGTGFSSLSYLNEFPLDSLKIDRSFIDHLGHGDPKGSAIADAIIQIGKALSLTVVAEAVSTEPQLQMVRDLGCHLAQGFLLSRPVSAEVATEMLRNPETSFIP